MGKLIKSAKEKRKFYKIIVKRLVENQNNNPLVRIGLLKRIK